MLQNSSSSGQLHSMVAVIELIDVNYFSEECSNKGGTNGGSCASGFGVCCTCKLQFIGYIQRVPTNKYFRLWNFSKHLYDPPFELVSNFL